MVRWVKGQWLPTTTPSLSGLVTSGPGSILESLVLILLLISWLGEREQREGWLGKEKRRVGGLVERRTRGSVGYIGWTGRHVDSWMGKKRWLDERGRLVRQKVRCRHVQFCKIISFHVRIMIMITGNQLSTSCQRWSCKTKARVPYHQPPRPLANQTTSGKVSAFLYRSWTSMIWLSFVIGGIWGLW